MFRYYVQQNQWLIASLALGLAVLALFVLSYVALWRERDEQPAEGGVGPGGNRPGRWLAKWTPWALLIIWLGSLAWGAIYTYMQAANPPNW
jgi:hypothetical protein